MATTSVGTYPPNVRPRLWVWDWAKPLVVGLTLVCLWGVWAATATAVQVTVDGNTHTVYTHRREVEGLLLDAGVVLHPTDRVAPAVDTPLRQTAEVVVTRARRVQVVVDGRTLEVASWGSTARAVMEDAGLAVDPYDRALLEDQAVDWDAPLPPISYRAARSQFAPAAPWARMEIAPLQLRLVRALPLVVDDGGLPFVVRTTAQTVGEALRQAEITIYLGDRVIPSLGSEVSSGLRVYIQRSVPVMLSADGKVLKTRTRGETVADALAALKIGVNGHDRVEPPLTTPLYEGVRIQVTRVSEEIEVTEQIAPFETVYLADGNLAIDTQQVVSAGAEGVTRTRYRVRYEDGQEVARVLEDTWVAQEPQERVIAYGQRIEPRTATAADGTQFTYWRRIRMLASSYSAGTAGVSPNAPNYGRTYTGERMRFGIVAVDPSVIPLRSQVYVDGYGRGDALDTGSAVRARRIDLGYDDANLVLWNRWVDVYLLWPPPPAGQITWVLPNWPRPPQ